MKLADTFSLLLDNLPMHRQLFQRSVTIKYIIHPWASYCTVEADRGNQILRSPFRLPLLKSGVPSKYFISSIFPPSIENGSSFFSSYPAKVARPRVKLRSLVFYPTRRAWRAYCPSVGPSSVVNMTVHQCPSYLTVIGDLCASFKIVPISQRQLVSAGSWPAQYSSASASELFFVMSSSPANAITPRS